MKEAMDIVFAGGRMRGGEPEDERSAPAASSSGVPVNISEAILDRAECLALLAEAQAASDAAQPVALQLEEPFVMVFSERPPDVAVQFASAPM